MNFNANNKFTPEFTPSQVKFESDPDKYIKSLNPTQIAAINSLIKISNIHGYIYPSQQSIANWAGVSRPTANRYLKVLHEDGLLYKKYNHRHTCDYYLHPVFFEKSFRERFSNILKCLNWIPLIMLLSATISNHVFGQMNYRDYAIPLNKKNYLKRKQQDTVSSVNTSTYVEDTYTNVKNYNVHVNATNRKYALLQSYSMNKKESNVLKKLADELRLGNYELNQLSVFDEDVLKHAYVILQKSQGISNKFKYLLGTCKGIQAKRVQSSPQGSISVVKRKGYEIPEERKNSWDRECTAEQIASELMKINEVDASKMYGGELYKRRMIYNWANKDYVPSGDEYEYLALRVIDKYRIIAELTPRNIAKIEPQSIQANEMETQKGNALNGANSLSNVKFEADYKRIGNDVSYPHLESKDFEEVLD